MDRGLNGRTLGHKRLYCAQCASNADIGKLLVRSSDVKSPLGISKAAANRSVSSVNPGEVSSGIERGKFNWKYRGNRKCRRIVPVAGVLNWRIKRGYFVGNHIRIIETLFL